jgi:hypothetical protein
MIVLKLDFCKAFDSISWPSLDVILAAHGFGDGWRTMVSSLLATRKIAIMLNSVPELWIQCWQGLR